ncbi:hypothetical protein VTL71DRAFT_5680 [Oculimacula yallundae]|uniref:Uncharacterized protein n=1 Tax=Oculimacula yallundae TaxID=86028 RepID=A0ABR4BY88_9HELO
MAGAPLPGDPLNIQIQFPLSPHIKSNLVNELWGCNLTARDFQENPFREESYFQYLADQVRLVHKISGQHAIIRTFRQIVDVVNQFRAGSTYVDIATELRTRLPVPNPPDSENLVEDAIGLVVRLWLMIHTGRMRRGVMMGHSTLIWNGGVLSDVTDGTFQHQIILTDSVKLQRYFTARNLERMVGVTIKWTSNIADHLRLTEDGFTAVLNIFHYASFLEYHQTCDFFPDGFIEETIRTLKLLLPEFDGPTVVWFKKYQKKLSLDERAVYCGILNTEERQIDHFYFWHDRLIILKQFFDEAKPRTFRQWWVDDRHRVQWFWLAIAIAAATIILATIQCIEGGWQVYKSYNPSV